MSLIGKIAGTFTFKLLGAVLNFLIVVLISRYLGPAGKGETSLLIANISVILLFTGILGGTALIYLTPRINIYQLLLPAYAAAFFICLAGAWGFYVSGLGTAAYCLHLGLLALLLSLFSVNNLVLLGKEQVWRHNLLTFLVPLLTGLLLVLLYWLDQPSFAAYRLALYGSYGALWLLSWYYVRQLPDAFTLAGLGLALKQLARYGFTGQLANIFSFLNNRLSFYLLRYFISVEAVGMYSVGVSVSEGLWLVGRSIALVQYARIANSLDVAQSARETVRLARLSLWLTVLALLVLLTLPASFYQLVFGAGFGPAKKVVLGLSPGIAAVSLGNILVHFFSGLGQYQYNVRAAGLGLGVILPAAWLLIPLSGLWGAALATSLSQLAATAYLVWAFGLHTGQPCSAFLPGRQDLLWLKTRLLR
jgi:O-antigen/teichoic acid export membrane protein